MSEEVQTGFRAEGEPAFPAASTENENSAASSTGEQTNGDQSQSQEGQENSGGSKDGTADKVEVKDPWAGLPDLATHPRWKERETDWTSRFNQQEERHVQELAKIREEISGRANGGANQGQGGDANAAQNIPAWFGGDAEQWAGFQEWNKGLIQQAREGAASDVQKKSEEEQAKIQAATDFLNSEVSAIEGDKELNPQGSQVDRNKLLKFVVDNDLVDSKGQWNYRAAFKMMGAKEVFKAKAAMDEKRAIASATTSEGRAETTPPEVMTSADFTKPGARPW